MNNTLEAVAVEIELDKKRSMILDHWALALAERELNKFRGVTNPGDYIALDALFYKAVEKTAKDDVFTLPYDLIQVVLWASLLRDDPNLTLEAAARLIKNRRQVTEKVIQVWQSTWPKADPNEATEGAIQSPLADSPGSTGNHSR